MPEFTYLPLNHAAVHGFLFESGVFVYSAKAKAAKALNAFSCWLLLQLEEGISEAELIKICQQQNADLPLALLQQEIAALKALQCGDINTDPENEFVQTLAGFPLLTKTTAQTGFDVAGLCVCVHDLPEALKPYLQPVLLHKPHCSSTTVCSISFLQQTEGFSLVLNNKPWPQLLQAYEVAPMVLSIVRRLAAMQQPFFATLHAGLVGINNRHWVFSGSSGAGKSTLCAQLLALGQQVLTDEVVLLNDSIEAQAVPLALGLKENSWPLLQDKLPIQKAIEHQRLNGIKVKYQALKGNVHPQKVSAFCFVRFDATQAAPFELTEINTFAAVQQLFVNGLELTDFSLQNFRHLLMQVGISPCFQLSYRDSEAAAKYLLSIGL